MTVCETPDFMFPMQASVYHPIVEQGQYGAIKKHWVLDRVFACSFTSGGSAFKEEVKPNVNITQHSILVGRSKSDLRISSLDSKNALTNILITDIKDQEGNLIYIETSGPRSGKGTLFEIATYEPFTGPFGTVESYNMVIRRSENQTGDV
jgi:hypothetical protein